MMWNSRRYCKHLCPGSDVFQVLGVGFQFSRLGNIVIFQTLQIPSHAILRFLVFKLTLVVSISMGTPA